LCCSINALSQGLSFEYSVGYGTFQLNDIKEIKHSMPNQYGLRETDYFPNYITHSFSLGYDTLSHRFGAVFSYLTTGGRLNRADYSGSFTLDMIMNGYRLGLFYRYYINTGFSPLSFYLQVSPGLLFSNLEMKEQVDVYSELAETTTELEGFGIYLEPAIGAKYRITNWLQLSLGGGYEVDLPGKMKMWDEKTRIKSKWDGFRLYGGLILFYQLK